MYADVGVVDQFERWFAELTRKQLQRGVHTSTRQLEADIRAFIEKHNEDPKPFDQIGRRHPGRLACRQIYV